MGREVCSTGIDVCDCTKNKGLSINRLKHKGAREMSFNRSTAKIGASLLGVAKE